MNFNTKTPDWQTLSKQVVDFGCALPTLDLPSSLQALPAWSNLAQDDKTLTDWLIVVFNTLFAEYQTILVRGGDEPEYLAKTDNAPAQILFAHGYFASALHEISHWCIAGKNRRLQDDFGYWYCPDGRDKQTQSQFEQVEIKPQAVECLLTYACGRKFFVSADNLNADFDTSDSTFESDVYQQVLAYLDKPDTIPKDAKTLFCALIQLCQNPNTPKP